MTTTLVKYSVKAYDSSDVFLGPIPDVVGDPIIKNSINTLGDEVIIQVSGIGDKLALDQITVANRVKITKRSGGKDSTVFDGKITRVDPDYESDKILITLLPHSKALVDEIYEDGSVLLNGSFNSVISTFGIATTTTGAAVTSPDTFYLKLTTQGGNYKGIGLRARKVSPASWPPLPSDCALVVFQYPSEADAKANTNLIQSATSDWVTWYDEAQELQVEFGTEITTGTNHFIIKAITQFVGGGYGAVPIELSVLDQGYGFGGSVPTLPSNVRMTKYNGSSWADERSPYVSLIRDPQTKLQFYSQDPADILRYAIDRHKVNGGKINHYIENPDLSALGAKFNTYQTKNSAGNASETLQVAASGANLRAVVVVAGSDINGASVTVNGVAASVLDTKTDGNTTIKTWYSNGLVDPGTVNVQVTYDDTTTKAHATLFIVENNHNIAVTNGSDDNFGTGLSDTLTTTPSSGYGDDDDNMFVGISTYDDTVFPTSDTDEIDMVQAAGTDYSMLISYREGVPEAAESMTHTYNNGANNHVMWLISFKRTDPDTSGVDLQADTIKDTNTVVTITMNVATYAEILDACLKAAPRGWYYYIDPGTNIIYFKSEDDAATHRVKEKAITGLEGEVTDEALVNTVYFVGGDGGSGTNLLKKYQDADSLAIYGLRAKRVTDRRFTDNDSADIVANAIINRHKNLEYRYRLMVMDSDVFGPQGYDVDTINVGDVLIIADMDHGDVWVLGESTLGDHYLRYDTRNPAYIPSQISQVIRYRDSVMIICSTIPPDVDKRVEDLKRNLDQFLGEDNPDSPS